MGRVFELVRYGAVSGAAFLVDFAVLVACVELLGLPLLLAAAAGFLVGGLAAYVLCVKWAFAERRFSDTAQESVIFFAIGGVGLALNHLMMSALAGEMGLHYQLAKLCSAICVFGVNFGLRKMILFSTRTYKGFPAHD